MSVIIILAVIFAILFGLAYITKRRFGALGLALAAGSMLSELWAAKLTPLVAETGLLVERPPLITIVSVLLVLAPALILLFSGPSYHQALKRIIGALLFAALGIALLIEPIGSAMVLQADTRSIYEAISDNRVYIVTTGLILAVLDLVATRSAGRSKRAKH